MIEKGGIHQAVVVGVCVISTVMFGEEEGRDKPW